MVVFAPLARLKNNGERALSKVALVSRIEYALKFEISEPIPDHVAILAVRGARLRAHTKGRESYSYVRDTRLETWKIKNLEAHTVSVRVELS